jgi:hypothetical protein
MHYVSTQDSEKVATFSQLFEASAHPSFPKRKPKKKKKKRKEKETTPDQSLHHIPCKFGGR